MPSLADQPQNVQQIFQGTWGDQAGAHWAAEDRQNHPQSWGGSSGGGISDDHRTRLRDARYGDWANPGLTEGDYAAISQKAEAEGAAAAGGVAQPFAMPSLSMGSFGSSGALQAILAQLTAQSAASQKAFADEMASERAAIEKQQMMMQRRSSLLGFAPTPGKDRASRSLAAIFQATPEIREQLINDTSLPATDYQDATNKWLASSGNADLAAVGRDPMKFAVKEGYMPPLPPRTVNDMMDQIVLDTLRQQGLSSPDLEKKLNASLEQAYQADLTGNTAASQKALGEDANDWMLDSKTGQYVLKPNAGDRIQGSSQPAAGKGEWSRPFGPADASSWPTFNGQQVQFPAKGQPTIAGWQPSGGNPWYQLLGADEFSRLGGGTPQWAVPSPAAAPAAAPVAAAGAPVMTPGGGGSSGPLQGALGGSPDGTASGGGEGWSRPYDPNDNTTWPIVDGQPVGSPAPGQPMVAGAAGAAGGLGSMTPEAWRAKFETDTGSGVGLPPTPSTQLFNQRFMAPERQGTIDLFKSLGIAPTTLQDLITRAAPPSGPSSLANQLFSTAQPTGAW